MSIVVIFGGVAPCANTGELPANYSTGVSGGRRLADFASRKDGTARLADMVSLFKAREEAGRRLPLVRPIPK